MNQYVTKHVRRLGGKPGKPRSSMPAPYFYVVKNGSNWEGKDPKGELKKIPKTVSAFDAVKWAPRTKVMVDMFDMGEWQELELCGASENYEVVVEKKRLLLYQIGWTPISQFIYALNLLDDSEDPPVYRFDHAEPETAYSVYDRLSYLLSDLKTDKDHPEFKTAGQWHELAEGATENGDYERGLALYAKSLKDHHRAELRHDLGWCHDELGQLVEAEKNYRKALEIDPSFGLSQLWLCYTLRRRGKLKEEKALLDEFIRNNPKDGDLHYERACLHAAKNEKDKMLRSLEVAVRLDKKFKKHAPKDEDMKSFHKDKDFLKVVKGK